LATPPLHNSAESRTDLDSSIGVSQLAGNKNEDVVICKPGRGIFDFDMYGVCDGHGGRGVAQFVSENLPICVRAQLARAGITPRAALAAAFIDCHNSAHEEHKENRRQHKHCPPPGGTCALCTIVLNGEVWIANAGDCRAVLSRPDGSTSRLTTDHKPTEPSEAARIQAVGGQIINRELDGSLAVSRGIGDFAYCRNGFSQLPTVVGPLVLAAPLASPETSERAFLVLASDGVWDVFSDDEACSLLRSELTVNGKSPNEACDALLEQAKQKGSQDDKSVVLLCLPLSGDTAKIGSSKRMSPTRPEAMDESPQPAKRAVSGSSRG